MNQLSYVKTKIGDSYLIWLQKSNKYIQLEEPAWYVFEKLASGYAVEDLSRKLSEEFELEFEDCKSFVGEMDCQIGEMNAIEADRQVGKVLSQYQDCRYEASFTYQYQFGERIVRFRYEDEEMVDYIHPLVKHLAVDEIVDPDINFELFTCKGEVVFKVDQEVKGVWTEDESHLTKGRIYMELCSVLHEKISDDWLMTVHASAITNKKKTVLFSAAPGSGKTTMAALLQANGYYLISDDFVPFDRDTMNAYPFPVAMSVKEGALKALMKLYPALADEPSVYFSPEKTVRYLPVKNDKMNMIYPVNDIVFIKYNPEVDIELERLDTINAAKDFLDQVWVPPVAEYVEELFERMSQLSFYRLTYSDNDKALDAVKRIFEDE